MNTNKKNPRIFLEKKIIPTLSDLLQKNGSFKIPEILAIPCQSTEDPDKNGPQKDASRLAEQTKASYENLLQGDEYLLTPNLPGLFCKKTKVSYEDLLQGDEYLLTPDLPGVFCEEDISEKVINISSPSCSDKKHP